MDRYNFRRPSINRELTAEERQELNNVVNVSDSDDDNDDDNDENESEYDCNDDDSIYDEADENTAIDDVELIELEQSFEEDVVEDGNEQEDEEEVGFAVPNRGQKYRGQGKKDKTVWWSMPDESEQQRTALLKRERMNSFAYCTRNFNEKHETFKHFLPSAIVEQIVVETNRKAKKATIDNRHDAHGSKGMRAWVDTNANEIYAYIGILLYAGARKSNKVDTKELFEPSHMPFYRAVMSGTRFEQLTRYLRFDDSRTRLARLQYDKLAPIRHIWTLFLKNLTTAFTPSLELCIDEQLLVTRNRCSFRQYIPSKPGKYGIKIFWLVDATNNFPIAGEIYVGSQPNDPRSAGVAYDLVLRLSKSYLNMGANITMDNFFTSYNLATFLAKKDTTIVGTIRSNKRQLPKAFTSVEAAKQREVNSSVFCYSNECELLSYITPKKNICLLSTAHASEELNSETGKPTVIHDYNKYKGGVDTLDKMLRGYTCKRRNSRWPMMLFYNMIDVAAFAAYRSFELCRPAWKPNRREKRKVFLEEMALELAENHVKQRCEDRFFTCTYDTYACVCIQINKYLCTYSPTKKKYSNKVTIS